MSTLTLCISVSVHTLTSAILLHKLCSVTTLEHSESFPLENYVRIVALAPKLQTVSVYGTTEIVHHSFTIELLSLLILRKGSYPSFKAYYQAWKSSLAVWLPWHANLCKVATLVGTS